MTADLSTVQLEIRKPAVTVNGHEVELIKVQPHIVIAVNGKTGNFQSNQQIVLGERKYDVRLDTASKVSLTPHADIPPPPPPPSPQKTASRSRRVKASLN